MREHLRTRLSAVSTIWCVLVSSLLLAFSGSVSGGIWLTAHADADGDGTDEEINYKVDETGLHGFIDAYYMQKRWHIGLENIHEIVYRDETRILDTGYWTHRSGGTHVDGLYNTYETIYEGSDVATTWESDDAILKRIGNMNDERCIVTYQIWVRHEGQFTPAPVAEVAIVVVWNDGESTISGARAYVIDRMDYYETQGIGYLGPSPYGLTFTINYTFDDYVQRIDNSSVIGWDGYNATDPDSPGIFGMLHQPEPSSLSTEFSQQPCVEHTLAVWEIPGNEPPVADFTWDPPVPDEGEAIQFLDASTDPDGQIVSWEWTFEYLAPSMQQHPVRTYGDNGVYEVTLEVADIWNATDNVTKQVTVENCCPEIIEVNSTLHENKQRTHGYWKKQCDFDEYNPPPSQDHVGIKQEYVDYIAQHSIVWSELTTKDQVCENLTVGEQGGTMVQKLRMQLITVWLNIAAGFLFKDSPLDHPLTTAQSLSEFIYWAEDAILRKEDDNPSNDPTYNELQDLKNVTDDINNDAGTWLYTHPVVGEFEATVRDAGSDDLILEWDFEGDGLVDATVIYYNDPATGPDPYPSPWGTFPFWVNDWHVVGYATPPRPFETRLYVLDDDGCLTPDEDQGDPWSIDWSFRYDVSWKTIEYGFTIYDVPVTYLDWDSNVTPRDPMTGDPMFGNGP